MEKPEKYTLKAGYKFEVNGNKIVIHFYKYAGMYFFTLTKGGWSLWNYILDQKTCHQSMNKLKKMFDIKPIKYSKNKKHNISLTPAGKCLFDCPLCDSIFYIRNQVWELDDRWYDCETQGIFLQTDRTWSEYDDEDVEKYEINMDEVIKSAEEFRVKIIKECISSFGCDICKNKHCYDNIYFCKQCEIVTNQYNYKYNDDVIAPDIYNLCRNCYTKSNIKAHADKCNNYCGFYLKPTIN